MAQTLYMSDEGVPALIAQVDRAREDAEQAHRHVQQHSALSLGQVGVLPETFGASGAHKAAVEMLLNTLEHLAQRTKYVVEGINTSAANYKAKDDERSTVFTDLATLLGRGEEPPNFVRYGHWFPGMDFTDLAEPTEVLRDPATGGHDNLWSFDPFSQEAFSPSAWVRQLIQELTGRDPFEEAVQALSGDWTAFQRVLFLCVQVKQFSERLGRNLARAAYELPMVWTGREAEAAQWYLHALANAASDFAPVCEEMVEHYTQAVNAAKDFNEVASSVLSDAIIMAGLAAAARYAQRLAPNLVARRAADVAMAAFIANLVYLCHKLAERIDAWFTRYQGLSGLLSAIRFTKVKDLTVRWMLR